MPDQNNPATPVSPTAPTATPPINQLTPQVNQPVNPIVTTDPDVPPLPPDFQNIQPTVTPPPVVPPTEKPEDIGSAAPSNLPPMVSTPKKKFGGGRIIATILGVLLLVGGVGAGLVLTQQQQLFQPKASCTALCLKNASREECGCTRTSQNQGGGGVQTSVTRTGQNQGATNQTSVANNNSQPAPAQAVPTAPVPPAPNPAVSNITITTDVTTRGAFGYVYSQTGDHGKPYISGTYIAPDGNRYLVQDPNTAKAAADYFSTHQDQLFSFGFSQSAKNIITGGGVSIPAGGPVSCNSSGYSNFDASTVSEPCTGGGYNIEKIAHTGCPSGQTSCWCTSDSSNCTGGTSGGTKTTATTPPVGPTATCQNVKAYSTNNWILLTPAVLSTLKAGHDSVYFCITGSTTGGVFDMAKFTINGVVQPETTTKRPGSQDFCQLYNLPVGTTSFTVTAQIHHATLGWSN